MKKILIIALLFVGCDNTPTNHDHSHEESVAWIIVSTSSNFGFNNNIAHYINRNIIAT